MSTLFIMGIAIRIYRGLTFLSDSLCSDLLKSDKRERAYTYRETSCKHGISSLCSVCVFAEIQMKLVSDKKRCDLSRDIWVFQTGRIFDGFFCIFMNRVFEMSCLRSVVCAFSFYRLLIFFFFIGLTQSSRSHIWKFWYHTSLHIKISLLSHVKQVRSLPAIKRSV